MVQVETHLDASGIKSLRLEDNLSGYLFLPVCFLICLMLVSPLYLVKKYKKEIKLKLQKLKKKHVWSTFILPFSMSYYSNCEVFSVII